MNYIEFEKPIVILEEQIEELRKVAGADSNVDVSAEVERLKESSKDLIERIFSDLNAWQVTQLARHPKRPLSEDYFSRIFTDFDELHGDRHYSAAPAIIGGVARFDDEPVVVIGHQKGRDTKEKLKRNFGMPSPEGYRKALRLMKMAERFNMPVFTFIDTAGAYPGIGAEERNQSEAIARNLFEMSSLRTPIICTVIGEGGSGGALAIGVGDRVNMLQYSVYSVISPEGCASILWKDASKAKDAAEALGITSDKILELGLIDKVIKEPFGGAHRNPDEIADNIAATLSEQLGQLQKLEMDELLSDRYKRLMSFGIEMEGA